MLNLNKILEPAKTIAIGGHVRPDGDCVGSCMAMYQYIQNNYPDKEVDVFLEEIPSTFYRSKGRMRFYMRLTRVNIMICSLYWTVEIPEDWSFLCHCS